MLSMQHEGHGKAAKVDENLSQWTKICRSTVQSPVKELQPFKVKCWNFLPYILKAESTPPFPHFPSTSLFETIYQGLGPGPVM